MHTHFNSTGRRREAARAALGAVCLVAGVLSARPVHGQERVWATGKVIDAAGKPLPGAVVAAYDDSGKIVDYNTTDANGAYALALPENSLHLLPGGRGKDLFTQVCASVTRFVAKPVGQAVAGASNMVRALTTSEAASAGNPVVAAGLLATGKSAQKMLTSADTAATRAAKTPKKPKPEEKKPDPGALRIRAIAPGCAEMTGTTGAYWIEHELPPTGKKGDTALAAWLDPIQMLPESAGKPSHTQPVEVKIAAAKLEPAIAQRGQEVKLTATLSSPPEPQIYVVMVARDSRTGETWALKPTGKPGEYAGAFTVEKNLPANDQTVSVLAYAAEQSDQPARRPELEKAIEKAGLWDVKKPFAYNPLLTVSRNRVDLTLSVLPDKK